MSKAKKPRAPSKPNPPERSGEPADAATIVQNWMLTVPESPSARYVRDRQKWVKARYPAAKIAEIAKAARFSTPQVIRKMNQFLLTAGYVYDDQKNNRSPIASFAPDREYLGDIAQLADSLGSALRNMNDVQARSFWHPLTHVQTGPASGRTFQTSYGLTVTERPNPDGTFVIEHLRPHQIMEAIEVTRNLANAAVTGLPKLKGGHPQVEALQNWIRGAQLFWRDQTSAAFTPVMLYGKPASPALAFCWLAFQQLDANVEPTQLASAMRSVNKKYPASKCRSPRNRQQQPR